MPTEKTFKDKINAAGTEIAVISTGDENDYISIQKIPASLFKTG